MSNQDLLRALEEENRKAKEMELALHHETQARKQLEQNEQLCRVCKTEPIAPQSEPRSNPIAGLKKTMKPSESPNKPRSNSEDSKVPAPLTMLKKTNSAPKDATNDDLVSPEKRSALAGLKKTPAVSKPDNSSRGSDDENPRMMMRKKNQTH